ncbi:hypothetical protein [Methanofollis sp. W23]|uniref:sacsin N-terminal ATP-binding-like domain-containing protein n=1 Tax=Methanofollis sp. W23 TaxID=2817849 RepID=UPI001AE9E809|nr:hypothetical protein [Methanofollis sp. W23]
MRVSDQQNYITQIRNDFEASQRVKDSLNSSIHALADDLYSKDTHFIFELIQNAEDNSYNVLEPSLSFQLVRSDPTGTPVSDGALIIQNNEVGFSSENVSAICKVGQSTKTDKTQGYIGEKGIGFKSVFRVTTDPHIFSNGYRFRLPEHDEKTELGYIVPLWVDEIPDSLNTSGTTIILPLNKSDFSYESIEKMLRDIDPVTVLFLSKLKKIVIETETGYRLSIRKDDSRAPCVQVIVEGNDQGDSFQRTQEFIVHTRLFHKPDNISSEKRNRIDERDVSIALPLDNEARSAGKVFAYLPVHEDTGLPFLLNADFLLSSSREAIHEGDPWNQWLRDCIPEVFVEAFERCLDIDEFRERAYGFIPLESHATFFEPVVSSIQNALSDREIVLTEPEGKKCKPSEAWTAGKNFRSLLSEQSYPEALLTTRLVLQGIEKYKKQLQFIGVSGYTVDIVRQCFLDREWIEEHDIDWIIKSYQYLSSQKSLSKDTLAGCPIVPVETESGTRFSCDSEQPIYFECDDECEKILGDVPKCARVKLAFLQKEFYTRVKDNTEICEWMSKTLEIHPFSKQNYAIDVLQWLKKHYQEISDDDLVSATIFLSQFASTDIDFTDIPVLLSDNRKMLLSQAKALHEIQVVVTPEALDPETGWQNIFATEEDRKHLVSLSDHYIKNSNDGDSSADLEKLWSRIGVTCYPLPIIHEDDEYGTLTKYEDEHINDNYSLYKKWISNWRPFESLKSFQTLDEIAKIRFSQSLINWLKHQNKNTPWLQTIVEYFYYSQRVSRYDSEIVFALKNTSWLPTTKGYVRPDQAFLPLPQIREIFGDTAPYFEDELPEHVVQLLGIRTQATAGELITLLEQKSHDGSGSRDFAERVYRYLASLNLDFELTQRFKKGNLILIPQEATTPRWASVDQVIWNDHSEVLGDEFFYLKKYYPDLEKFFVETLSVKKDVDTECFARRWLCLQNESNRDNQRTEKILTTIYQRIRHVCTMSNQKRPAWWDEFKREVKVWTENSTFEQPASVYIPDDGELKQIFQNNEIDLVWYPHRASHLDWENVCQTLGLRYLSDALTCSVAGNAEYVPRTKPELLTDPAKILIATWIFEKYQNDYKKLLDRDVLGSLLNTTEALTDDLNVIYCLEYTKVKKSCDAFWDVDSGRLLISKTSCGRTKNAVARALARGLMPNHASMELSNWIELVLGEDDWEFRIQDNNWNIPDEIKEWMDSRREDQIVLVPEPETPGMTDRGQDENIPCPPPAEAVSTGILSSEGSAPTYHTPSDRTANDDLSQNYGDGSYEGMKSPSCSGSGTNQPLVEHHNPLVVELPEHESRHPDFRATHVEQMAANAPLRISEVRERSVSVGLDDVKLEAEQYLRDQYTNEDGVMICQICKNVLPFKLDDGSYYTEKVEFLTDLKKRHYQNYLALCPNHSAMFQHANASRDVMGELFEKMQGNEMEIVLAKKPRKLYFTKTHIADLKAVIASEKSSHGEEQD